MKIFGKAQVDISLALGTLIGNSVYPETEPEFQQLAYFTTRIGLQNTTQIQEKTLNHLGKKVVMVVTACWRVVKDIAISVRSLGFDSRANQSDPVSRITRHCCDVSSEMCCQTQNGGNGPPTRLGVIVSLNFGLVTLLRKCCGIV